tara:strand:+ start:1792 stop:2472 length:681 start_codon:yes stop_codon:yes gene_type:complete
MYFYLILLVILVILLLYNPRKKIETFKGFGGNPFKKVNKIFKLSGQVIGGGFSLLEELIEMSIDMGQLLFLIIEKGMICFEGSKDFFEDMSTEVKDIQFGLMYELGHVVRCMNPLYVFDPVGYYEVCTKSLFSSQSKTISYITRMKNIFQNPKLFALSKKTKYGYSKEQCQDKSLKKFEDQQKCNQCFNFQGLIAKGFSQLLELETLMKKSVKLFTKLAKLEKAMG